LVINVNCIVNFEFEEPMRKNALVRCFGD